MRMLIMASLMFGQIGEVPVMRASAQVNPAEPAMAAAASAVIREFPTSVKGVCSQSLQACISASADGDTVLIKPGAYLIDSVTVTRAVNIVGGGTSPAAVKLRPSSGRLFTFSAPSIVSTPTIMTHLTLENARDETLSGVAIYVRVNSGIPLFQNLVISNNVGYDGAGISIASQRAALISGTLFYENWAHNNGGAVQSNGPVTLINSRFDSNRANVDGGALAAYGAISITNSSFFTSESVGLGGAVWAGSTVRVIDSLFDHSRGPSGGCLYAAGRTVIKNSTLRQCSAYAGAGGAIHGLGHVHVMDNSRIERSSARSGGGLYATELRVDSDSTIVDNYAQISGGGAYVMDRADILDSNWLSNTSAGDGGALTPHLGAHVFITNSTFSGNATLSSGGAIFHPGDKVLNIRGSTFSGNRAGTGGALACFGDCHIAESTFSSNQAYFRDTATQSNIGKGGAVFSVGDLTIDRAVMQRNSSGAPGGGAVFISLGFYDIVNTLFANNLVENSAGIPVAGTDIYGRRGEVSLLLHNTFVSYPSSPYSAVEISQTSVINYNIFSGYLRGIVQRPGSAYVTEGTNLWHNVTITATPNVVNGQTAIYGDPLFNNAAGGNFHLRPGSPAIDRAVGSSLTLDHDGQPRPFAGGHDIGFDEVHPSPRRVHLPAVTR
jgi:predicted outer membrane repeat protein